MLYRCINPYKSGRDEWLPDATYLRGGTHQMGLQGYLKQPFTLYCHWVRNSATLVHRLGPVLQLNPIQMTPDTTNNKNGENTYPLERTPEKPVRKLKQP